MNAILIDTNVVLDVLLDRQPFVKSSAGVWRAIETGAATGFLSAHAVTTIHYLVSKQAGVAIAKRVVSELLEVFRIAAITEAVIHRAVAAEFHDFEDAVTAAAAGLNGCDYIVTRDPKGFRKSAVKAVAPESVIAMLTP